MEATEDTEEAMEDFIAEREKLMLLLKLTDMDIVDMEVIEEGIEATADTEEAMEDSIVDREKLMLKYLDIGLVMVNTVDVMNFIMVNHFQPNFKKYFSNVVPKINFLLAK